MKTKTKLFLLATSSFTLAACGGSDEDKQNPVGGSDAAVAKIESHFDSDTLRLSTADRNTLSAFEADALVTGESVSRRNNEQRTFKWAIVGNATGDPSIWIESPSGGGSIATPTMSPGEAKVKVLKCIKDHGDDIEALRDCEFDVVNEMIADCHVAEDGPRCAEECWFEGPGFCPPD